MVRPHDPLFVPGVAEVDRLSVADRLEVLGVQNSATREHQLVENAIDDDTVRGIGFLVYGLRSNHPRSRGVLSHLIGVLGENLPNRAEPFRYHHAYLPDRISGTSSFSVPTLGTVACSVPLSDIWTT